ncbi:cupin-like domain-containing protein [Flagellimonas taeanensis]|uniref:Cupin-like domain-containing protein n=1 Tax=Flagellimonas taeanensis TaxID=1005926 RepID=A0A1M6PPX3_9FLAO|nr:MULTISPECIES: cupin-like domain-containing protein [Allomuricauda]MDC6385169.1 cupin-like domain-containing protein [Muricauda sp. SK9]MEE1961347.1 cupin-like domain-containing protein [Allomuricauda taeanensis]RIV52749.1 cupin-like domain-containing protein [Allomuricauda taeanensis]SFB67437.1 Cupin-like domain-containing protein [Allomuricauda taeanensis]SHK09977.1 Cupin-like domain-containing protein [Allomuricauda taeanensis]
MKLNLEQIPRETTLSKKEFIQNYFKPQKPVVIERFIEDWPAHSKWSLDYMKQVAGEKEVPLYDDRPVKHDEGFNQPHAKMKMSDYVDLLKSGPTKYRIFLWNILKEVPELQKDFTYPDFGLKLMKGLPMLFFGGEDSYTFMHYDIDLANIFHFHFEGKKQCILYSQSETKFLYKIPHSLITREDIDFDAPDFEQWPALEHAKGHIADLEHGNVLYIPEGYWHYMKYVTPGFSMSLRSIAKKPKNLSRAVYNIFVMRHFDNLMRKWKGQQWIDWKNEQAVVRTQRLIAQKWT